jgi:peptidoglycan/LPS O-acetylase OafA/YrhL
LNEFFPIAAGLFLGSLLQFVPRRWRLLVGVVGAAAIGFTATVISGEYKIGWEFLAIDISGAALAVVVGFAATKRARKMARHS